MGASHVLLTMSHLLAKRAEEGMLFTILPPSSPRQHAQLTQSPDVWLRLAQARCSLEPHEFAHSPCLPTAPCPQGCERRNPDPVGLPVQNQRAA